MIAELMSKVVNGSHNGRSNLESGCYNVFESTASIGLLFILGNNKSYFTRIISGEINIEIFFVSIDLK